MFCYGRSWSGLRTTQQHRWNRQGCLSGRNQTCRGFVARGQARLPVLQFPEWGSSWFAHAHKAAVVLAGQRPEERAHVRAFKEEADGVDADARAAGDLAVPASLERTP